MKLISWNVNGLRACMQKGFTDFVEKEDPDILALQETKMQPGQAAVPLTGYHVYWNSAEKKGYSGTAMFTKEELEKMIAPSSYTGICSVLARELADKAEAKAKMMTEK